MARDIAKTDEYVTSRRERKKVEMLFAHLKRNYRSEIRIPAVTYVPAPRNWPRFARRLRNRRIAPVA
jgi:hypothetical protein